MRTAILLLCLALVHNNSARVLQNFGSSMADLPLEEQIKIHEYEQQILQILLKKQKTSQNRTSSQRTHESTSVSSNAISQENKDNSFFGWLENQTTADSLIALQEKLTSNKNPSQETKDPEHIFTDALEIARHVSEKEKQSIRAAFAENKEVNWKNAIQLIEENDYKVERHEVKTRDGYYITMFRVQPKQESLEVSERPVVLMVHGLFGSADDWLMMGPKKSLAYQMVDAGFDVWLGNVRGSKYSQRHSSKHSSQQDFWDFSIDEIATHDLPAMIDYILTVTQETKLHYVGHSLSATAFFAMASAHPQYKEKVAVMYALAPMVYMNHVRSPLFRTISPESRYYPTLIEQLGYGEFKPSKDFLRIVGGKMYENVIGTTEVASNVNYVVYGVDSADMDRKMTPTILKHLPAGASVRQIKHYGQAKAAGQLKKFDYGAELNMEVYGDSEPPSYNMTDVNIPVAIYYSEEDLLAHPKDVDRLHSELPDVLDYFKVPEQHFSHMDFLFSETAHVTINKRLIDSIKRMS